MLRNEKLPDQMNGSNLRMKNNLVQRQFDLYASIVDRQVKGLADGRDQRVQLILKDKIKKINNFKKFQYDTEFSLQESRLKSFMAELSQDPTVNQPRVVKLAKHVSIKTPGSAGSQKLSRNKSPSMNLKNVSKSMTKSNQLINSTLTRQAPQAKSLDFNTVKAVHLANIDNDHIFNQVKYDLKTELASRFRLKDDPDIQSELSKKPQTEKSRADGASSDFSDFDDDERGNDTQRIKKAEAKAKKNQVFDSTVDIIEEKMDVKNKHLSIAISGKFKKYFIYKLEPNGEFSPYFKQPTGKKAVHDEDNTERQLLYFKEMYNNEQAKFRESQRKIQRFYVDLENANKRTARKSDSDD